MKRWIKNKIAGFDKLYEALESFFKTPNPTWSTIVRIFSEGIDGFKGGLSAENYIKITKTSRATATRDLGDLVSASKLKKRATIYLINFKEILDFIFIVHLFGFGRKYILKF